MGDSVEKSSDNQSKSKIYSHEELYNMGDSERKKFEDQLNEQNVEWARDFNWAMYLGSVLREACRLGNTKFVTELMDHPKMDNSHIESGIKTASMWGKNEVVVLLLKDRRVPQSLDPIIIGYAINCDYVELVELLLGDGRSKPNAYALDIVDKRGSPKMRELLNSFLYSRS